MSSWLGAHPAAAPAAPAAAAAVPAHPVLVALAVVALTSLLLLLLQRRLGLGWSKGSSSSGGSDSGRSGKGLPKSVAKAAYESLRARELAWLRGLPPQVQAALAATITATATANGSGGSKGGARGGLGFPAHALVHSGQIGMVLLGVKPCAVVGEEAAKGAAGVSVAFAEALAEEVLRPWMEEFHLSDYGFVLTRVASPCAPPEIRGHGGFEGAALFYWRAHPEAGFVESILRGRHPSMPGRLLAEALGYPGFQGRLAVEITYLSLDTAPYRPPSLPTLAETDEEDEDEEDEEDEQGADGASSNGTSSSNGSGDAPSPLPPAKRAVPSLRVPMLAYVGREEDGQRIGQHFRRVGEGFMAVFGQPLALDIGRCERWDPGALAKLLVAAFPSAFEEAEATAGGGDELGGLLRCLESGALVPYDWMRARFPELPPVVRMLRLVEKLRREKEAEGR